MNKQLITIAQTTLYLLNKKKWSSISVFEIYQKSKVSKKNFDNNIKNKKDILSNIIHFFDWKLNKVSKNIDQSSQKDMIFEIMMMRFDILQENRRSVTRIFEFFKSKPQELVLLLPSFIDSMILMANMANIPSKGLKGNLKIKGLLVIYFSSFLIWMKDNSQSLEKTMTSLNNNIERADNYLNILNRTNVFN